MSLHTLSTMGKGAVKFIELDLASLDSTRTAAQEFLRSVDKNPKAIPLLMQLK
jgi:uncharacterized protein YcsI (UPF0317 family)